MSEAMLIMLDIIVFGFIISFSVACIIKLLRLAINKILTKPKEQRQESVERKVISDGDF